MALVETHWLVYGESGVPVWLVLIGLAAALAAAHRWLRVERQRRKGWMSRCLPFTLSLILGLLAWVAWNPVLVRNRSWEQRGRIVAAVDRSDSMNALLDCRDVSTRLDMLTLWDPAVGEGRDTVARRLLSHLAEGQDDLQRRREWLLRLEAEGAQGLPLGQADRLEAEAARAELARHRDRLQQEFEAVREAIGALPADWKEPGSQVATRLEAAAKQVQPLARALDAGAEEEGKAFGELAAALQVLLDGLPAMEAGLREAQNLLDSPFLASRAADLEPRLKELAGRSRFDAAMALGRLLPADSASVEPDPGDVRETDVYEALERAVARHDDEVISHVLWLSDGGHNGGPPTAVAERLKKEGIPFLAVGVGVAESTNSDFAVCDWQAPRVTRAERTLSMPVRIKAPPGVKRPFVLKLSAGGADLARAEGVSDGQAGMEVSLTWKTPAAGRHTLKLAVESPEDRQPANNAVTFVVDTVAKAPELLLIGLHPDWDTAYLTQAAARMGLNLSQVFTEGKAPKRGGFSGAVPNHLEQWRRYQTVLLRGPALTDLSDKDAEDLFRYVVEAGHTLVIMTGDSADYARALAARFGWLPAGESVRGPLRLGLEARHYPLLRLGPDGAQSARRFAAMGESESAFRVPAQQVTVVESERGEPVCSLGFYGKGRVLFWGLNGLYRLREYTHAESVDRLLDSVLGDGAAPLGAPGTEAPGLFYPALPVAAVPSMLILPKGAGAGVVLQGHAGPATPQPGVSNAVARVIATNAVLAVTIDGKAMTVAVAANPGMEQLYPEFSESSLKRLAEEAGGQYVWAPESVELLKGLQPRVYRTASADVYPVGRHSGILAALVFACTLHWIFRKLSGMAI